MTRQQIIKSKVPSAHYNDDLMTFFIDRLPDNVKLVNNIFEFVDLSSDYTNFHKLNLGMIFYVERNDGVIEVHCITESTTEEYLIEYFINCNVYVEKTKM